MSAPSRSSLRAETEARLRFEMLVADVSAQFVNVAASDVDSKIENAQRIICETLMIDHSSVWRVSEENPDLLVMAHVYGNSNLRPLPLRPAIREYFPWSYNKIQNNEIVCVPNTAKLPLEAAKDKESWEQNSIHSSLVFPLSVGGGSVIGVLAFDSVEERVWPEPQQRRLQILAHIFAQALDRKDSEQKVRESENRFRLVADTAPVLIWQSGRDKLCTYFNKPWLDFTGRSPEQELGNGWAAGVHSEDLQRCLDTYRQSFDRREKFQMEYRLRRHDGAYRWMFDIGVPRFNQDHSFAGYIGICVDVTDGKEAEQALQQANRVSKEQTAFLQTREELLKIFVKHVPAAVAMLDRDMHYLQVSDRWCANYSVDGSQILGRSHYDIFPDIPERWKQAHRRALGGETLRAEEDRWDRESGTSWEQWEIRPWQNLDGRTGGILIFSEDITRRKQMEEALSGVSRRLIEAQERERGRIARELHDDICQQLALVSVELEQVQRKLPDSVSEHRSRVAKLRKRIVDISADVQVMSHDLHSAKLSYLGITIAMKGLCREFGKHHKVEIEFESRDVPRQLQGDVSLCLFRVLQEALHNAAKHSGVKRFDVKLWRQSGDVHLTISDLGSGFDTKAAMKGRGLGITSMQERIKLVKGELTITSQPKRGTMIHARAPLDLASRSARAAG